MKNINFKTTYGSIIIEKNQEFLLVKRDGKDGLDITWEFPGGDIENYESILAGVLRELKEEAGAKIIGGEILFSSVMESNKAIVLTYSCKEPTLIIQDYKEKSEMKWDWFKYEEILEFYKNQLKLYHLKDQNFYDKNRIGWSSFKKLLIYKQIWKYSKNDLIQKVDSDFQKSLKFLNYWGAPLFGGVFYDIMKYYESNYFSCWKR